MPALWLTIINIFKFRALFMSGFDGASGSTVRRSECDDLYPPQLDGRTRTPPRSEVESVAHFCKAVVSKDGACLIIRCVGSPPSSLPSFLPSFTPHSSLPSRGARPRRFGTRSESAAYGFAFDDGRMRISSAPIPHPLSLSLSLSLCHTLQHP